MEVGESVAKDKTVHEENAAGAGKVVGKDRKEKTQFNGFDMQLGHAGVNRYLNDVGPLYEPRHPKRGLFRRRISSKVPFYKGTDSDIRTVYSEHVT